MSAGTPHHLSTVIIIDDDPIVLQLLTAFFVNHAAQRVLAAQSGAEALALLKETPQPDLIISDLHMPDFDGIEFMNHLQAINSKVPLLLISSAEKSVFLAAKSLAEVYELNLIGTLTKPVNFAALAKLLGGTQFAVHPDAA